MRGLLVRAQVITFAQDKECDKAARILRSFCSMWLPLMCLLVSPLLGKYYWLCWRYTEDGFYTEEDLSTSTDRPNEKHKQRVLKKIPQRVIQNAGRLAVQQSSWMNTKRFQLDLRFSQQCGLACGFRAPADPVYWLQERRMEHGLLHLAYYSTQLV